MVEMEKNLRRTFKKGEGFRALFEGLFMGVDWNGRMFLRDDRPVRFLADKVKIRMRGRWWELFSDDFHFISLNVVCEDQKIKNKWNLVMKLAETGSNNALSFDDCRFEDVVRRPEGIVLDFKANLINLDRIDIRFIDESDIPIMVDEHEKALIDEYLTEKRPVPLSLRNAVEGIKPKFETLMKKVQTIDDKRNRLGV